MEEERKSIEDFLEVINDKGVSNRIRILRQIRSWYDMPDDHIAEIEQIHLDALCRELPKSIIQRNQKLFRISWGVGKFAVNVSIGHFISETASFLKGLLQEIASEAINEVADEALDATKAQERVGKLISKRRQIALAGILRDWLTKRIVVDDRKTK